MYDSGNYIRLIRSERISRSWNWFCFPFLFFFFFIIILVFRFIYSVYRFNLFMLRKKNSNNNTNGQTKINFLIPPTSHTQDLIAFIVNFPRFCVRFFLYFLLFLNGKVLPILKAVIVAAMKIACVHNTVMHSSPIIFFLSIPKTNNITFANLLRLMQLSF